MVSPSKPSKSFKKISPSFRGVIKDKQKKGKKKKEVSAASVQLAAEDGEDLYQEPVRRVIRPENQLKLTKEQLKEDVSRVLTGDDPNAPRSVSKYNFKDRCYKPDPPGQSDHMAVHLYLRGNALHADDDDYKAQKEAEERRAEAAAAAQREETNDGAVDGDDENKSDDRQQRPPPESDVVGGGKNAFNYSDRSSQTLHDPSRHRGVSTEPPAVAQYGADVSQWRIYDSYLSDHLVSGMEEKNERNDGKSVSFEDRIAVILDEDRGDGSRDADDAKRMADALRIMERLVNQNAEDEIFQDFKYWEDASDSYREGEGSLLPLWRFTAERSRRRQVTDLCWNPRYSDLFAVGYGSYDFVRQGSGVICCFSLKNTSFPEYTFATESGVMCLDFHPQHPSLLAVGCYDGTVLVFNIGGGGATNSNKPIYASTTRTGKHADPVWQVHWQKDDSAGGTNGGGGTRELNFYSISSDGRVANWSLSKNDLKMEPVMQLKLVKNSSNSNGGGGGGGKDDHSHHPPEADITNTATSLTGLAGGCCFDFNRTREHLFIVGTEEGNIHKCSKAYSGQYLETYSESHHMAVYAVRWNPFHPSVFVSCSADWTVRLWDDRDSTLRPSGSAGAGVVGGRPFAIFDLGNAVGDVCWSPRSSTVFAAVTDDGKVRVFDLSVSKHGPLCEQRVVARARLTRARFNARDHVVVVGDDRGGVSSLKLSPNLRRSGREDDDATTDAAAPIDDDDAAFQRERMDRLLATFDSGPSSS